MTTAFSGGGLLAQQLAAALTPATLSIVTQFGSDVTVYRPLYSKRADASTKLHLPPHAAAQRMALNRISAARAQKTWGVERLVTGEAIIPGAVDVEEKDILVVTAGPHTGEKFLVEHLLKHPEAGVMFAGIGPYKGAVGRWYDHPDIALYADAEDQEAGSQVVVSSIGPNGWLGESVSDAVFDPTLDLTSPARWVMGQTVGTMVRFGDVLGDVFNAANGFTLGTKVELGDDALPGSGTITTIINKDRHESGSPNGGGVWLRTFADALWFEVHFDEDVTFLHDDTYRWPAVLTPGRHSLVVAYNRLLATRALRASLYIDGVLLPAPVSFASGVEGDVVTAGRPLELGGYHGSGLTGPESAASLVVASGPMREAWAEDLAADAIARGWT